MGSLYQIVYTSTATADLDRVGLLELLKGSVQRNTRAGITGLLLYQDRIFLQVLEGDEQAVFALFAKISRDSRHHHVIPLIRKRIEERDFADSAMAFRDLDNPELRKLPGYSDFLNSPLSDGLHAKDLSECRRLLLFFKENHR